MQALGRQPVANDDAMGLGQFLLVERGVHLLLAAPVGDGHLLGAEQLGLDRRVDGGHAAAENDNPPSHFKQRQILGLAQHADEIDGVDHARSGLLPQARAH